MITLGLQAILLKFTDNKGGMKDMYYIKKLIKVENPTKHQSRFDYLEIVLETKDMKKVYKFLEDYNEGKPVEFRHFSIIQCPRWERIYHVFKGDLDITDTIKVPLI